MVLVQALFAGMHTTASPALEYIPPVAFCALRLLLALPFLWWLARHEGGRWFRWHEFTFVVPMGAAIGTAYVLIFVCNQRSGPNMTAMVQPAMPICTTVLSALLGLEKVGAGKLVGLLVATFGTAVTLRVWEVKAGASLLDAVFLLTQANAYAVYIVLLTLALKRGDEHDRREKEELKEREEMKERGERKEREDETDMGKSGGVPRNSSETTQPESAAPPGPMRFLFAATVIAEIGVVGFAADDLAHNIKWQSLPPVAIGAVLYAGLGSSCLAHGLNSWAISKVQGILPSVYSGAQVVFTVVFAYVFLGLPVGYDRAAGSAVTVAGVYVVSRAKFLEMETRESLQSFRDANANDAARRVSFSGSDKNDEPEPTFFERRTRRTSVDHIAVVLDLGLVVDSERGKE